MYYDPEISRTLKIFGWNGLLLLQAKWEMEIMNKSFRESFGKLTVEEALKLNEAAKRTCEEDS